MTIVVIMSIRILIVDDDDSIREYKGDNQSDAQGLRHNRGGKRLRSNQNV